MICPSLSFNSSIGIVTATWTVSGQARRVVQTVILLSHDFLLSMFQVTTCSSSGPGLTRPVPCLNLPRRDIFCRYPVTASSPQESRVKASLSYLALQGCPSLTCTCLPGSLGLTPHAGRGERMGADRPAGGPAAAWLASAPALQ